jgi:hypothetical protein
MALLQLPKKGISPTKDGAVPAVKDAGFLLLLMADKGAVAAVKKVFAPLKMVLLLLLKITGKDAVAANKNKCCCCQRWLLKALLVMVLLWQQKKCCSF